MPLWLGLVASEGGTGALGDRIQECVFVNEFKVGLIEAFGAIHEKPLFTGISRNVR